MRATNRKGVAMLAALGVLVILGLMSGAFAAHMRLETAFAALDGLNFRAQYLAVAGVQDAIARIEADSPEVDAYNDGWWLGETPDIIPLGEGGYSVRIADECALINILNSSPQVLGEMVGGDNETVAKIVNYRSSPGLFAIEDIGRADLSADGLARTTALGTTIGDGKININTANADVIAALPGMDPSTAQVVIEFRRGEDGVDGTVDDFVFARPEDISQTPGLTPVRTAPAIPLIKVNSNLFRVESVGSIYKGKRIASNNKIVAVFQRDANGKTNIISWESSGTGID